MKVWFQSALRTLFALPLILAFNVLAGDVQEGPDGWVEAVYGEPLGVGKLTLKSEAGAESLLNEKQGRVHYPVHVTNTIQIRGNEELPKQTQFYFLFRGKEPLEIRLNEGFGREVFHARVLQDAEGHHHKRLLNEWWLLYRMRACNNGDAYPLWIDDYLVRMLAQRLNLELPEISVPWQWEPEIERAIGLVTGAESVRIALQSETFLDADGAGEATEPLPVLEAPPPVAIPDPAKDVVVEPLALRVPEECFYLRCADWNEFRWFRDSIDKWGGSLRDLIALRGRDYGIGPKIEKQLALEESALAKLFGNLAVEDVAIVGTDFFVREGAAIGILFHARNNMLLSRQITNQRARTEKSVSGATRSAVKIGDRNVSLLATKDNRVRSFYVCEGDYHLVTNSSYIVRRFIETSQGTKALGRLKEFRYARTRNPLAEKHAVFIYLSDPFFRNLVSSAYRVEMTRRVKAQTEIELLELARMAAQAEGRKAETLEALQKQGFLPKRFGRRPGRSHVVMVNGHITDSLRGARGSFLPIADVKITKVTKAEVQACKTFAAMYRNQWERTDPVMLAIGHQNVDKRREKVTLDVHISPYARQKYWFLREVLQKDGGTTAIGPGPNDLLFADVGFNPKMENVTRAFAGIRDLSVPFTCQEGKIAVCDDGNDYLHAYLGISPPTSHYFLGGRYPDGLEADRDGIVTETKKGASAKFWWRDKEFMLEGTSKEALMDRKKVLKPSKAARPAQLRLHVGDLSTSKLRKFLDACLYVQGERVSNGNLALLETIQQQLGSTPQDARSNAERLLGAQLVSPLGGTYKLAKHESKEDGTCVAWCLEPPAPYIREYRSPLLDWLGGLKLEFLIDDTALTVHLEMTLNTGEE